MSERTHSHWVMDYETMKTLFVAVFIHYKTDEKKVFIIHRLRNDLMSFLDFLDYNKKYKEWHIGFNNLAFDSQITEYILRNRGVLQCYSDPNDVVALIYNKAQEVIHKSNTKQWPEYPEWKMLIPQVDVFKMNHWDNVNKSTSLKWSEYSTDWHNLQEMPIHHTTEVTTQEEIDMIADYCENDVLATKQVLHLSKPLVEVRTQIKAKYGLKCYNYSNTKLGSELLLKLYCDITGKDPREVKQLRTPRASIAIKDILFPYIEFKSFDLQGFHEMLKTKTITNTKKDFMYSLKWRDYTFEYGAGGIHQCIEPGVYEINDEFIIKDLDVASLYPSIACMNEMYPAHLGRDFFKVYKENIVDVRLGEKAKPKADRNMAIIEGFKEAANASYGNSNSEYSWLYDPQYTMQTTINGQLLLTMLIEELIMSIPKAQLLQTNTDGATIKLPKESLPEYQRICKEWEAKTKLTLEFADYKAMYIWDVNNYFAVYTDGKHKCKGRFEWEDLQNHKHTHLHKNKSYLIVAKAIFNYFVNNIPPEQYLAQNRNIFDYCAGMRAKGSWIFRETCVVDKELIHTTLQKTVRYYISNKGCKIVKYNTKDYRDNRTEAGLHMQTVYNKHKDLPWEQYDVDDSYYLEKIYTEIQSLVPVKSNQMTLF